MPQKIKKLVTVIVTFLLITIAGKKVIPKFPDPQPTELILKLQLVLYIYYPGQFKEKLVQALINSSNKINIMNLMFAKKIGLWIEKTDVGLQKINGSSLGMVIVLFSMDNKVGKL